MKELFQIFGIFFKMGGVTFGGGYAMLPILKREIVERFGWLTEEEVMDFYAISQGLTGIIAINVATFIGYSRRKTAGAVAAALGMVAPSLIIITAIATILVDVQDNLYVQRALAGITVGVCALVVHAVVELWKKGVCDLATIVVCITVFLLLAFTSISPIFLVVGSALFGIFVRGKEEGTP
ncbi:MAG: chromate transporter [Eubacteriales bacterium]